MREIKFRIKFRLIKDGKIVGYEWHGLADGTIIILHSKRGDWAELGCYNITIHPKEYIPHDTKEQFTGLHDKNGKDAYRHDKGKAEYICAALCENEPHILEGTVEWDDVQGAWMFDYEYGAMPLCDVITDFEIIGSIHDPEPKEKD